MSNIRIEQVAIGESEQSLPFFYVDEAVERVPGAVDYATQLGSFSRDHILKHSVGLAPYVKETLVATEPIMSFLVKREALRLDCLLIDAEGHDYAIMNQLDFSVVRPKVIIFEHAHMSDEQRKQLGAKLTRAGYHIETHASDLVVILKHGHARDCWNA